MNWNREQAIGERALRDMAKADAAEMKRLRLVEARCAAIVSWLETNKPEVFREGLWDAIAAVKQLGGDA
jgi:hypothetical protein